MSLPPAEPLLLPPGDYISPNLRVTWPDAAFPDMRIGDKRTNLWPHLRREIPHNWYVDRRAPIIGFLSRDEAAILYNIALMFSGKRALEIGCWLGWSACHLALGGVQLDSVDPMLAQEDFRQAITYSLTVAKVMDRVNLVAGSSPQTVVELAARENRKWSLLFIDGNHEDSGPYDDAVACETLAEADAMVVFHDLVSPAVGRGLEYFRERGWKTRVYQTMQIMGVAYRGNVSPIVHHPDPSIRWTMPEHLTHHPWKAGGASE